MLGENVAQAAQFVTSGNAQVGIIPLSLALAPEMVEAGQSWVAPQECATAADAGAIVLGEADEHPKPPRNLSTS